MVQHAVSKDTQLNSFQTLAYHAYIIVFLCWICCDFLQACFGLESMQENHFLMSGVTSV